MICKELLRSKKNCVLSVQEEEQRNHGIVWKSDSYGDVPRNAVYTVDDSGVRYYIARVLYDNTFYPGKKVPLYNTAQFAVIGKGGFNQKYEYEILVQEPESDFRIVWITYAKMQDSNGNYYFFPPAAVTNRFGIIGGYAENKAPRLVVRGETGVGRHPGYFQFMEPTAIIPYARKALRVPNKKDQESLKYGLGVDGLYAVPDSLVEELRNIAPTRDHVSLALIAN